MDASKGPLPLRPIGIYNIAATNYAVDARVAFARCSAPQRPRMRPAYEWAPMEPQITTPQSVGSTGLLCELAMVASLGFGQSSSLEFTFALPTAQAKYDSLLVCFNTPGMQLAVDDVIIDSITETKTAAGPATPLSADDMLEVGQMRGAKHVPDTTLNLEDALANDPYFAQSYRNSRYDDFKAVDPRLTSLVQGPSTGAAGNCAMMSGGWLSSRVYTITLNYTNPVAPSSGGGADIKLWLAPMHAAAASPAHDVDEGWPYAVRGYKYGALCGGTAPFNASGPWTRPPNAISQLIRTAYAPVKMPKPVGGGPRGVTSPRLNAGRKMIHDRVCEWFSHEKLALLNGKTAYDACGINRPV